MSRATNSLKDKLRHQSKLTGVSISILMKKYFIDCFLKLLSESAYQNNFIWKGGFILSAISGIEKRTTVDIDVLCQGILMDEEQIKTVISTIIEQKEIFGVTFQFMKLAPIMEEKDYQGYRVFLLGRLENIRENFHLDIATGETLVPEKISFLYRPLLKNIDPFELFIYRPERMLAEKLHTILDRGIYNSRFKDFFDVKLLSLEALDTEMFQIAMNAVFTERKSLHLLENWKEIMDEIEVSSRLLNGWKIYQAKNKYVGNISFAETIVEIRSFLEQTSKLPRSENL